MTFYAYILQSVPSPDHLYHGHSSNLKQRLANYNRGHCPHTAKFSPWKLKFYAAFETLERPNPSTPTNLKSSLGANRYPGFGCVENGMTRSVNARRLISATLFHSK